MVSDLRLAWRNVSDWSAQATRFEAMAAMISANVRVNLKAGRDPVQIEAAVASNDFFRVTPPD